MSERWLESALCHGTDPEVFFPVHALKGAYTAARALCAACEVIEPCRMANDRVEVNSPWQCHGFVAGETPPERLKRRGGLPSGSLRRVSPIWGGYGQK